MSGPERIAPIRFRLAAVAAAATCSMPAIACTLCHSAQATSVRARLLQPDLWLNLGAVVLPLALLASILVLVASDPARGGRTA